MRESGIRPGANTVLSRQFALAEEMDVAGNGDIVSQFRVHAVIRSTAAVAGGLAAATAVWTGPALLFSAANPSERQCATAGRATSLCTQQPPMRAGK